MKHLRSWFLVPGSSKVLDPKHQIPVTKIHPLFFILHSQFSILHFALVFPYALEWTSAHLCVCDWALVA